MNKNCLIAIELDETIGRASPQIEHERAVAIFDLIEDNHFSPLECDHKGPYRLKLSLMDKKLILEVLRENREWIASHSLSLMPFRRLVKDYSFLCEGYYDAIRSSTPSRIEALDMGRRGLHNEGAQALLDHLDGKIEIDFRTARRFFTLLCVLHWRG